MTAPPASVHWLFWETDASGLDTTEHRNEILARILERGRLEDVAWALAEYGEQGFLEFFRRGHPALSDKTRRFWQLFLDAREETWPLQARSAANNSAPWID
ncbi:MAG TPA: hypothetical protein PKA88_23365 [Polyangiaceae bacterium]|nr:hypothetical protein [Polyangiaceae bacterium]HMR74997.1 hypothetical protein [Polyangiaceae bacterium]